MSWTHTYCSMTVIREVGEIPLFFDVELLSKIMSVSLTTAYMLTKEDGFPTLRFGRRIIIPKEEFIKWISDKIQNN